MTSKVRQVADASQGLRLERSLFTAMGPQVALWTSRASGVVCPRIFERRAGFAAAHKIMSAQGWPVYLRPTGGGAVPQGDGIVNLAIAYDAPSRFTIEDGYRLLIGAILKGLRGAQVRLTPGTTPGSFCDGAWNLSIDGQKVVGTAQRWRPHATRGARVLAHAIILTEETFQAGTDAVAAFHRHLGLGEINRAAHTSLTASTKLSELPVAALLDAAMQAGQLQMDTTNQGGNHVQRYHPHSPRSRGSGAEPGGLSGPHGRAGGTHQQRRRNACL